MSARESPDGLKPSGIVSLTDVLPVCTKLPVSVMYALAVTIWPTRTKVMYLSEYGILTWLVMEVRENYAGIGSAVRHTPVHPA